MQDERRDREQLLQENEYTFPYHHVVQNRDGFSQCFNDGWGLNYLATIEFLLDQLRHESFASAVDIGCGDGRFTKDLGAAFPAARIVGVDFSSRAIALAKAMVPGGDFRCADITTGELAEQFDLAVLMEVYEHIPPLDALKFADAVADLLRPGGVLYVTVPHVNKPVEAKHYRHFTIDLLTRELEPRFELTAAIPFEKISVMKWVIDCLLTNPLFVLRNRRIGSWLYSYYKRRLLLAGEERRCKRIILRMQKR